MDKSEFNQKYHYKFKANISLLVILVLLASSIIALLSIHQIQNLMSYGNMTFNYFRSYYLGKAGVELALTEVYNRENGFNNSIGSGDSIVKDNLISEFSGFNPYFSVDIKGEFPYLTNNIQNSNNCNSDNAINLGTGEGLSIGLFRDKAKGTNNIMSGNDKNLKGLEKDDIMELKQEFISSDSHNFTFGLFVFSGDNLIDTVIETGTDLSDFLENKSSFLNNYYGYARKYITIKNSGSSEVKFCISSENNKTIPSYNSLINVRSNFGNMEVGLQSTVKKITPDWSLGVLNE